MSEWNQHPFLDPNRQHSYEGQPPNAFANPYDFAEEHEWYAVNGAIERDLRERLATLQYSSTQTEQGYDDEDEYEGKEGAENDDYEQLIERLGAPMAYFVNLVLTANDEQELNWIGSAMIKDTLDDISYDQVAQYRKFLSRLVSLLDDAPDAKLLNEAFSWTEKRRVWQRIHDRAEWLRASYFDSMYLTYPEMLDRSFARLTEKAREIEGGDE